MAKHDFGSFAFAVDTWAKKVLPAQVVGFQKMLALELFANVIIRTPVDKGFLRGAWTMSISSPSGAGKGSKTEAKFMDPLTGKEKSSLDGALTVLTGLPLGQAIWLANMMPYVERIEFEGWSQQAPAGMVSLSMAEIVEYAKTLSVAIEEKLK